MMIDNFTLLSFRERIYARWRIFLF